jgi:hypothetical protein
MVTRCRQAQQDEPTPSVAEGETTPGRLAERIFGREALQTLREESW